MATIPATPSSAAPAPVAAPPHPASAGVDTYVPSIDGPEPEPVAPSAPESEPEAALETTQPWMADAVYTDPVMKPLFDSFVKRTKLDPNDPEAFKTLKTLTHQEKTIRELRAKAGEAAGEGLTEFERSLRAHAAPGAAAQPASPAAPAPAVAPTEYPFQDAGSGWRSPGDAYAQIGAAWTDLAVENLSEPARQAAFQRINNLDAALWARRFHDIALPMLAGVLPELFGETLQSQLGDVLPAVRETAESHRLNGAREFALAELAKTAGYEGIGDLTKPVEGPPIEFEGEQYPNTIANRIMIENPEILDIRVSHPDRDTADKLTFLSRFRAIQRIHSRGQAGRGSAQDLLKAGAQLATRNQQDRARQAINAGGGTNQLGGARPGSFVGELLRRGEEDEKSFAEL